MHYHKTLPFLYKTDFIFRIVNVGFFYDNNEFKLWQEIQRINEKILSLQSNEVFFGFNAKYGKYK